MVGGLVQQQQARRPRPRHGQLQLPLFPVRQVRRAHMAAVRQAHVREPLHGLVLQRRVVARVRPRPEGRAVLEHA
ncbi:hypothetical protein G6F31_021001 [Rhizopus arrhizus]|nr:hypothetical protein G6F31_021001 [Rhizopus arrhizus]